DPEKNSAAIYALLQKNQDLAEYEVARFFVAKAMAGDILGRLRSLDPRERLEGVRTIPLVCPGNMAAKLLRMVFKDPDQTTRKHARHVMRKLRIRDVALADRRFDPGPAPSMRGPYVPGAFNPTGWAFGTYARRQNGSLREGRLTRHRLPVLSTRTD